MHDSVAFGDELPLNARIKSSFPDNQIRRNKGNQLLGNSGQLK